MHCIEIGKPLRIHCALIGVLAIYIIWILQHKFHHEHLSRETVVKDAMIMLRDDNALVRELL